MLRLWQVAEDRRAKDGLDSQKFRLHSAIQPLFGLGRWRPRSRRSAAIGPPPRLQRPSAPRSAATPSRGTASVRVGSAPSLPHRLEVSQIPAAAPTMTRGLPEAVLVTPYRCSMQSQACTNPTSLDPRHPSSAARRTGELDNFKSAVCSAAAGIRLVSHRRSCQNSHGRKFMPGRWTFDRYETTKK